MAKREQFGARSIHIRAAIEFPNHMIDSNRQSVGGYHWSSLSQPVSVNLVLTLLEKYEHLRSIGS